MAKCLICNSRKGKRKCIDKNGFICSLCCGGSRSLEKCDGCSFYKGEKSSRNYKMVPYWALSDMADEHSLQVDANSIESAICAFDEKQDRDLNDENIVKIIKLLLDKYYFKDEKLFFSNKLEEDGFLSVDQAIKEDLSKESSDEIAKLLGTIYRSALRHKDYRRAYLDFIHKHVGLRIGKGSRLLNSLSLD